MDSLATKKRRLKKNRVAGRLAQCASIMRHYAPSFGDLRRGAAVKRRYFLQLSADCHVKTRFSAACRPARDAVSGFCRAKLVKCRPIFTFEDCFHGD